MNQKSTAAAAVRMARYYLGEFGVESAAFEARVMVETVLDIKKGQPFPSQRRLTYAEIDKLTTMLKQRVVGLPLQYLVGSWEFYGLEFLVGEGVLIPRQDTEALVEHVLQVRQGQPTTRLLDLCSGTGCIAAAIANHLPGVTGACVELSLDAMWYLKRNIQKLAPNLEVIHMDVCHPDYSFFRKHYREYDIITCNPPYLTGQDMEDLQLEVRYEPKMALYGGLDGLSFYRTLFPMWKKVLAPDGRMVFEVGKGQEREVTAIATSAGLLATYYPDMRNVNRLVAATLRERPLLLPNGDQVRNTEYYQRMCDAQKAAYSIDCES